MTVSNTRTISPAGMVEQEQELHEELLAATDRVLRSGWYILGSEVSGFEHEFATWVGARHAIGVASGTDALQLALAALDISPGDEVIIPSNALPTAYGVAASGGRIRFADARSSDLSMDLDDVASLLTDRTRAVVAVHLYGHAVDIDALRAVVGPDVAIVEDCAQAHGASVRGKRVGSLGDVAAWSFYPTKNLGAYGDGGAITTTSDALADRVRTLRVYGEERRYYSTSLGINSRLDELQAALLRVKLPFLDGWIARRRQVAGWYAEALPSWVRPLDATNPEAHGRHLYPVRVERRDELLVRLQQHGVSAAVHYPIGAHDQPCFEGLRERKLPVTERAGCELLSLPMHPFVTEADVQHVADVLASTDRAT